MVFHRDPFLVPCYLILIFVICFFVNSSSGIANYADESTPHSTPHIDQHCDNLISNLEVTVDKIFNWSEYNNLKANASKCHFFLSPYRRTLININGSVIKSSNC